MDKKNQILMSVLGVFALVIVTVGVSYAFFSYSRVGETTNTIISGDIQFSYVEGTTATLKNAFPVADAVGAADETGAYTFTVSGHQTGEADLRYNVTLMSANDNPEVTVLPGATYEQVEAGTHVRGYFTNDQIKISLQNTTSGEYLLGTSASTGVKLSAITAASGTNSFATGTTSGECVVVTNAEAQQDGEVYKLKMWISDDVDYSNTKLTDDGTDVENDAQTSVGKFNGFSYSLKVKVDAEATNMYQGTPDTGV